MHVGILSGGLGWHVQDLIRAAQQYGLHAQVYDFRSLHTQIVFPEYNIIRTMPSGSLEQIVFRMDLLHRAQRHGIRFVNAPRIIEICVDKFLTDSYLHDVNVQTPRTVVCQCADDAMHWYSQLGPDVVIKPMFGSEGRGMIRVTDPDLAWRCFRAIEQTGGVLYLQEFITNGGWDVRAFVIGNQVVAAIKRHAQKDWRANIAQGGRAEVAHLNDELKQLAVTASQAIGCDLAGVDMLQGLDGRWYILEVNGVPGWRTLSEVCRVDIASLIIQYVMQ